MCKSTRSLKKKLKDCKNCSSRPSVLTEVYCVCVVNMCLGLVVWAVGLLLSNSCVNGASCPNATHSTAVIESNRDYFWNNCSATTTSWIVVLGNGVPTLANVYIEVSGGAVLPFFNFSLVSSLVNVSIHVEGYVQASISLPVVFLPFVMLPLNCRNVQVLFHRCQLMFDGTRSPDSWSKAPSFITHTTGVAVAAFMSGVRVAIQSCTMQLALAGQSLVEFHLANDSNGVSVAIEDSTIAVTTSGVDVYLVQSFGVDKECGSLTDIITILSDISFRVQRSNITFVQNCSNTNTLCGNSINPATASLQTSQSGIVNWDAPNVVMVRSVLIVKDTTVVATLALPANESDATRVSRSMTLIMIAGSGACRCSLLHLTVGVSNIALSIAFGQSATLLRLHQLDGLSDAVITVEDSQMNFAAYGALNSDANTRFTAVIHISNDTVGPNLTIRMTRVVAAMRLLSGEQLPSAIASSPLTVTYATLIYCTAGIKKPGVRRLSSPNSSIVVVAIRDCRSTVDISNGSLTIYRPAGAVRIAASGVPWPSMSIYTMISTIVLLDRDHEVSALTVSIMNSSLKSSAALKMGSELTRLESAAVSVVTTLVIIAANCSRSSIEIRDSFVNVTAMKFPKMSKQLSSVWTQQQQQSGVDPGSGFLLLNITSLFQAYDTIALGQYACDKALSTPFYLLLVQSLRSMLTSLFATAILYDSVVVSVEGSTIYYPGASFGPLTDVVAFVLTPTIANNVSIDIFSSPQSSSSYISAQDDRLLPTVVSMLGSSVERCSVRVTGVHDAGPMIVASLGQSYISPSTSFVFTNNTFFGWPVHSSCAVFATGVNASLTISDVPTSPSSGIITIADNRFDGYFTKLFDEKSMIVLQSSSSSSSSEIPTTSSNIPAIRLGCNVWHGRPLPVSAIGIDFGSRWLHPRQLVRFSSGYFNNSMNVFCVGAAVPSRTLTAVPLMLEPSSLSASAKRAASVAAGMVCISYALPQTAVSITALQRALQALSLARRCAAAGGAADTAPDDFMADWMSNPLQMHFSTVDPLGWAAGSVVGNVVLIVCLTGVRWLWSSAVVAFRSGWSLEVREALRSGFHACGGLVSSYRDAYIALLQPLATAATALAVAPAETRTTRTSLVYALSVAGVIVACAPTVRWAWVVLIVWSSRFPFVQVSHSPTTVNKKIITAVGDSRARALVTRFALKVKHLTYFSEALAWRLASKPRTPAVDGQPPLHIQPADALPYLPVFDELLISRRWYFVVDFAFAVATAVLSGVASFSDQCAWGEWLLVALSLLNLVVVGLLRPYRSALSLWSALVNVSLCCVVALLAVLGYDDAATAIVMALTVVVVLPTVLTVVAGMVSNGFFEPPNCRGLDLVSLSTPMLSSRWGESQTTRNLTMLIRMACDRQTHLKPSLNA